MANLGEIHEKLGQLLKDGVDPKTPVNLFISCYADGMMDEMAFSTDEVNVGCQDGKVVFCGEDITYDPNLE